MIESHPQVGKQLALRISALTSWHVMALVCVFTGADETACDAAHLLPKSKGDEYIAFVLGDRLDLYNPALERNDLVINSIENGMLLRKDLHAFFAHGHIGFLKTPNFALDPADIPRVEAGPMPSNCITLHHLKPDTARDPVPQNDARMIGRASDRSPPSTLILDFMYGVAAYRCWGSGQDIKEVMLTRFAESYESIPIPPTPPHASENDSASEPDDPNDDNYIPPRGRNHSSKASNEMLRAMDNVLALSMSLKGTTPESIAAERERQEEAEELRAKEASQVKVQQWMQSSKDIEF